MGVMKVRIRYFATLRDRAGLKEEELDLEAGSTVSGLMETVQGRHPAIAESLPTVIIAVNREYAADDQVLEPGDEIALFPPVSGGSGAASDQFSITEDELDLNQLLAEMVRPSTGAACVFTGVVRGRTDRGGGHETIELNYEAYQPMAEEKMRQVAAEIHERWPSVEQVAIIQRVGRLLPGTPTVLIACTAGHRDSGVFEAARYGIDRLKQIVPIWKKEVGPQGEFWVEGDYQPSADDRKPDQA
jgi:molybdopterin converting factor subunit 1